MADAEKQPHITQTPSSPSDHAPSKPEAVDKAWAYLQSHHDVTASAVDLKALRRKIDWRIVPLMFCCYTMQFVDKVIINYAAVMGISKDLHLKGNNFTNAATAFFIAFLVAEVPNVYLLQKVPAAKWLGANVFCWGIATACTAATKNYHSLLAARIFLGIFEATIGPSLMIISSQWYTKSEQAPRFSFWYLGLGLGQIFGGLISFGFQHVKHAELASWRVMFIVLGLVTVIIGALTFFFIPDTPMAASWLGEDEKVALLKHVSSNQTGILNNTFRPRELIEAVLDPQIYFLTLQVLLQSVSSGVVTTYSATLIKNIGFSGPTAALLNMPSGVVSIFFTLLVGIAIRYTSRRWLWILVCTVPGIIGGGLMSFLPNSNKAGCLIGIYLVNAIVAPLPIIYQWTAANVSGYTKRAFASALIAGSFSVGNIIGPQTFQARDAPQYKPAKEAVLATQAAAGLVAVVLYLYYVQENKKRDTADKAARVEGSDADSARVEDWAGLTDRKNGAFRYVY